MTETAPETLVIDPAELTIGDLEDFEGIVGVPFADAFKDAKTDGSGVDVKALKAIIFIVKRHADPTFTIEQARDVKLSDFALASEPDPQPAAVVS